MLWFRPSPCRGNVEEFYGTPLTGTFDGTGNALDNIIGGGGETNTLNGADGNDLLFGNVGNDLLIGGNGSDTLDGSGGDDTLVGAFADPANPGDYSLDYASFQYTQARRSRTSPSISPPARPATSLEGATASSALPASSAAWATTS